MTDVAPLLKKYLKKNLGELDEFFRIKNLDKITERKEAFKNSKGIVEMAKIEINENLFQQIAIKSFARKNTEVNVDILKSFFNNEIINYQILTDKLRNSSNEEEQIKLNLFVDYVGFMMNDDENDPYFGSIITKFYPLGDLSDYVKRNREAIKVFNSLEKSDKSLPLIEINQLVYFAEQIAIGMFK